MAHIVIINPRFDISFWSMEHCIGLLGKRANLPVACLALLAALVPDHHDVTLIDENVEDIDFARLARADMVCLTGMSIQGRRMHEILERVRSFGIMTVVGGPLATVEEETRDEARRRPRHVASRVAQIHGEGRGALTVTPRLIGGLQQRLVEAVAGEASAAKGQRRFSPPPGGCESEPAHAGGAKRRQIKPEIGEQALRLGPQKLAADFV